MKARVGILVLILAILLRLPAPLYSQRLMFGATVDAQTIATFAPPGPPFVVDENRFPAGPMVEVRLPGPFSVAAQALYKTELNYSESYSGAISTGQTQAATITARAHAWEIPVVLKWRVRPARNGLFAGGGFAARNIAGSTTHIVGSNSGGGLPTTTFDIYAAKQVFLPNPWTFGGIGTVGVDLRAGLFHFQPEVRYTRWNESPFLSYTRLNSVDALLSVAIAAGRQ